jgi:uncharacterized membrane protein YfcA
MDWFATGDVPLEIKLGIGVFGALATGFVGGMVSLALGRPRLLLVYWSAQSPAHAAGTNILISSLAALSGAWKHYREGRVDLGVVAFMGIPTFIGAFIGGYFGGKFPGGYLMLFVAATTAYFGYNYLRGAKRRKRANDDDAPPVAAGPVPLTIRLKEMVIGFAIGLFGFAGHLIHMEIDWLVLALLAPAAMIRSWFGARYTGRVSDNTLKRWMGGVMIAMSVPLAWIAVRQIAG